MGGLAAAIGVFRLSEFGVEDVGVADVVESEGFAEFCCRNEFAALVSDDATVAAVVAEMLDAVPAVGFEFDGVEIADYGYNVLHFIFLLICNLFLFLFTPIL